jgi:inorganic pyrophosphatase
MDPARLPIWEEDELLVVVETPKGTPNKMKWDPELGGFRLSKVLPAGMSFPFDFGFVPDTRAPDGDPLDVLVLLDAPVWPGSLVSTRLLGVIEAEQREEGGLTRNDRLVAVASQARTWDGVRHIRDLDPTLLEQIEAFFTDYNRVQGREFRALGRWGPRRARKAIEATASRRQGGRRGGRG